MSNDQKDHLSKSQIGSLDRCEYSFLRRYGYGEIEMPSWALHAGSAIDAGATLDYAQKIESHENIPAGSMVEVVVSDFRRRNREEETRWDGVDEDSAVDNIAQAAEVFHANVMQHVQPVSVQQKVEVAFEGQDWSFLGFVDVVAEAGIATLSNGGRVAIDNKATGKSGGWSDDDVIAALDPLAYDLGLRAQGVQLDGFEFHIARYASGGGRWLKKKETQVLPVQLTDEARNGFLKLLQIKKARKDEILKTGMGAPRYGWWCKGCGYRSTCEKEWGRKPPGGSDG
jgi:hypothetical protein